ncbi:MAG: hypothetical protein WA960_17655 [Tunicatimonas sp.]
MRFDFLEDKLKAILNYVHPRRRQVYRALLQKGRLEEREFRRLIAQGKSLALINFRSIRWHDDRGRYAYLLAKSLDLAGYQLIFYPQFHFLSRLNKYKALLNALNFRVLDPRIARRVSSLPDSLMLYQAGGRKRVKLEWLAAGPVPEGAMPMPYGMHPLMDQQAYVRPNPERSTRRRVFFGGNTTPKDYQRSVLATRYGKINRVEVLGHLINQLDKSEITLVTRSEQLREALPDPRVVIVRTEDHPIATEDWLAVLSQSDFFLACPGAHMPMCHNVIEAMRVGTIPLLQYPEYFHPPLEPGVHCVVYRDRETLIQQTRSVLQMPPEEIIKLKKNVTDYYEQYLHPPAWIERLVQRPEEEIRLVVNAYQFPD